MLAQCSIEEIKDDPEKIIIITKSEGIYRNEDLENGLQAVFANGMLVVNASDRQQAKFSLIISYAKTSYKPNIIPRRVNLQFSNGGSLTYSAETYDSPVISGMRTERCFFNVSLSDMNIIKNSAVSSLTITDNRTNLTLTIEPYSKIFQEQIGCIIKRYEIISTPNYAIGSRQLVYTNSALYAKPDMVSSEQIGSAKDGFVIILEKVNNNYYKVKAGNLVGYMFRGMFKN
ncbi:SH3 domain-containing protein [Pedobacter sp. SD-b]|uniref:SH3 domain-containing protein n=1 Tax=Pedobacter segetis TaxID=2793069 RepID=A0ABS1BKS0_9SPHI|nr:SH3 domain-containing protein [Pedobacter segetis]MBK0383489.1 SH3 domain-containing protein [Pedobacter segetis]